MTKDPKPEALFHLALRRLVSDPGTLGTVITSGLPQWAGSEPRRRLMQAIASYEGTRDFRTLGELRAFVHGVLATEPGGVAEGVIKAIDAHLNVDAETEGASTWWALPEPERAVVLRWLEDLLRRARTEELWPEQQHEALMRAITALSQPMGLWVPPYVIRPSNPTEDGDE